MDIVEDIKNRVAIEDLVGQYVQLKKAGRNLKGLCPFHQEKTPSFMVSPEKQIAYCFGCNKGGDVFKFIEEVEGISFREAIEVLAQKAGLNVSDYAIHKPKEGKSEKDELVGTMSETTDFYRDRLKTKDGKKIVEYMKGRGVTDESLEKFEVGFAPDSFEDTMKYLVKKGITKEKLNKAGLLTVSSKDSSKLYDKFRGRLIFPIRDHLGRVVAFGGRAMKKGDEPKYLNSPETPVYHKSNILYGLCYAKEAIKGKDSVIVVEGYMDVVMCSQAGYENVVASSGTALTTQQLKLMRRYTKNLYFAFDTDSAGLEATKRAYLLAMEMDMPVKIVSIKEKDPADCIKEDPKAFEKALSEAKPFIEFYFDNVFADNDVSHLEGKQKIFEEVLPFLKMIKNKVQQDHYVRDFAKRVSMKESQVYDEMDRLKLPDTHPSKTRISETKGVYMSPSDLLLGFLLEYPEYYESYKESVSENDFNDTSKNIYKTYVANYNAVRQNKGIKPIKDAFSEEESTKVDLLLLYIESRYEDFSDENVEAEVGRLINRLKKGRQEKRKLELQNEIRKAEEGGDKEKYLKLLGELQEILK
ncbi:MAG: DNA primase [Patescibacteria group bacterium]|nr:DNA primase [Patescibacteria group bacterium]